MKEKTKSIPLVEEIINKSNSKQNNNNIILGVKNDKKKTEDDSVDFSRNELKENQDPNIPDNLPYSINKNLKGKFLEKYNEKLKEKTMKQEIDKRSNETERLKIKFEERNSHAHSFDNNPQFQKMLKKVFKQLILIILSSVVYLIYCAIIYFNISNKKEGAALIGMCLSITSISFCILLFISLNIGLLNDPNLSKTFRLFMIIEALILISSFAFDIILAFVSGKYIKNKNKSQIKAFIYISIIIIILLTFIIVKYCWDLLFESILILLGKKTEYSILIIKEQSLKNNEINFNTNLSVTENNVTNEALTNSTSLFNNEAEKEKDKEEEQYKTFSYYNKFHYSVTSSRKNDFPSFKKN